MIAIDTNLLIYAHRSSTREHRAAQNAIEKACGQSRCGIALASITEFLSVVTHPKISEKPSTGLEAQRFIKQLRESADLEIWQPGQDFSDRLMQMAGDLHVVGGRIFDLQIALTVFEHGATEIWSHDKNFVKIPGLLVVDPI